MMTRYCCSSKYTQHCSVSDFYDDVYSSDYNCVDAIRRSYIVIINLKERPKKLLYVKMSLLVLSMNENVT